MGRVFVTGLPGAGKSSVSRALGERALDLDDLAHWRHRRTGAVVPGAGGSLDEAFLTEHDWVADRAAVAALGDVFVCGAVANDDELWDLFEVVVYLSVGLDELRRRLAGRAGFGRSTAELAAIEGWHPDHADWMASRGAVVIDAERSLADVVADVVSAARGPRWR